jgi:hypothetical protein
VLLNAVLFLVLPLKCERDSETELRRTISGFPFHNRGWFNFAH